MHEERELLPPGNTRKECDACTRRRWSDAVIERTIPVLLGMYSLVCLWSGEILAKTPHPYWAERYR